MSLKLANVEKIYKEFAEIKKEDIDFLSKWMTKKHPHLPQLTELQLILFYYSCNCNIDATKTTIIKYLTLKISGGFFKNGDEELLKRTLATLFIGVLPNKTPTGEIILVSKLLNCDYRNYNCSEQLRVVMMATLLYVHQNGPAKAVKAIADFRGSGLGHLFRVRVMPIKYVMEYAQEAAPVKMTEFHIVNADSITKTVLSIVKPFIKREVFGMVKIHYSFDTLHEHIPKNCLPEDFGGDLLPLKQLNEFNLENFLRNMNILRWLDQQVV